MSQDDEPSYDNSHRAFLQAFIARSTMTLVDAKPVLAAIFTIRDGRQIMEQDITEADFNSYISTINHAISPLDLEIRSTFTQTPPRTRIHALVNTTSDSITQIATTHTADEISYLKRVLDGMFDTNNTLSKEIMAIKSIQALQLHRAGGGRSSSNNRTDGSITTNDQGVTKVQAEKMLKSLVQEGWFEKHGDWYWLSPRALIELRGWLLDTYNEPEDEDGEGKVDKIKLCMACKDIVTIGQRCPTRDCLCRLHDHCTQNFFRVQKENKCPLCKAEWTGKDFVGTRAAKDGSRASDARPSLEVGNDVNGNMSHSISGNGVHSGSDG